MSCLEQASGNRHYPALSVKVRERKKITHRTMTAICNYIKRVAKLERIVNESNERIAEFNQFHQLTLCGGLHLIIRSAFGFENFYSKPVFPYVFTIEDKSEVALADFVANRITVLGYR